MQLFLFAGIAGFALWQQRENGRAWLQAEAEREAQEAVRREEMAVAGFDELYDQCSEAWRAGLSIYWEPTALVWTHEGLLAYFIEGVDASSLRRVVCDAQGTWRGPRVARPLVELLPAEMEATESEIEVGIRDVLYLFRGTKLEGGLLAVELLVNPQANQVLIRRWRGLEGGAKPETEPADAPPFPLLLAGESLKIAQGSELPPLRELERRRWIGQSAQAFARIAEVLPPGAGSPS
ncbi:MAG: hypothetical protein HC897_04835 [Thermoanaerobaculia bacterium]|nr:hypothetical protein [Thermoanaerobaculia bacterium]